MLPGPARALVLARPPRRLRRAAQRGHLAGPRRRARRAGPPAGRRPRHPPRQDPAGQGPAGPLQRHLRLRRRERRPRRRPPRRPPGQPPRRGRPRLRLGDRARRLHPSRRAHGVRPLDAGDRRRGGLARHPVDPAQPVLPRPARPGRPRQADPRHDDLGDVVDRRRHRLRQGPHHQAARRRRPAGAQAGVGAHRGPGAVAAARRIGYPVVLKPLDGNHGRGVVPRPAGRGRRTRGVPDRRGPVAARRTSSSSRSSPARTTAA